MEKSKMAYLILKNLYNGRILKNQELGVSKREYAEVLEDMQKRDLISGVRITYLDQDRVIINNQNQGITVSGINHLMENTLPDKEYKIQVSVDEAAGGIEVGAAAVINGKVHRFKKMFSKPLPEIDVETEAFILMAEGLKREKESRKHAV